MWGPLEADFRREYGLSLARALPHMSWREFTNLLAGLSGDCAAARALAALPAAGASAAEAFWQSADLLRRNP